jgi:hypothetical protein
LIDAFLNLKTTWCAARLPISRTSSHEVNQAEVALSVPPVAVALAATGPAKAI